MESTKKRVIRPIHPFPARMAPELAFQKLKKLKLGAIVLDPMAGSGTVLRHASELGHKAIGFDLDPLAVLMTKVWTSPIKDSAIDELLKKTRKCKKSTRAGSISLPWIDNDPETQTFIKYWFAPTQRRDLRRLAFALAQHKRLRSKEAIAAANVLKVAFSRLIITKETGASLARDVSHSRPHKVATDSDFQVFPAFEQSVANLRALLRKDPPKRRSKIQIGDARFLKKIKTRTVDIVLTSPPYLNAIDYMRGHRLSLVWFGYTLSELRAIRSDSIGAERGLGTDKIAKDIKAIEISMGKIEQLPRRKQLMVTRYAQDVKSMMSEISRVLKPDGRAILVVGNSCLQNVFINNANGIRKSGSQVGLSLYARSERKLPDSKRYLPTPSRRSAALGKRMRTETILTFGLR